MSRELTPEEVEKANTTVAGVIATAMSDVYVMGVMFGATEGVGVNKAQTAAVGDKVMTLVRDVERILGLEGVLLTS